MRKAVFDNIIESRSEEVKRVNQMSTLIWSKREINSHSSLVTLSVQFTKFILLKLLVTCDEAEKTEAETVVCGQKKASSARD